MVLARTIFRPRLPQAFLDTPPERDFDPWLFLGGRWARWERRYAIRSVGELRCAVERFRFRAVAATVNAPGGRA